MKDHQDRTTPRMRGWALFTALCAAALIFIPSGGDSLIDLNEGDAPKGITLGDISGAEVSVTSLFGKKPVIIVFWELVPDKSFLNYSLDELLFLNDFYEKHHAQDGLEVFGIYTPVDQDDIPAAEIAEVQQQIRTNRISFPILVDRGFRMFREYGVIALPSTVMVGRSGKIDFIYPSFPIAAMPQFSEKIMELLGKKAEKKLEEAKLKGKDSQSVRLYNYALQMYRRGLAEQALSALKKSLAIDPDSAWAHNLMGIVLHETGAVESSRTEFQKAVDLDRANAPAHLNYGLLMYEAGKYSEAEKSVRSALALRNDMAEAHYVLGLVHAEAGDPAAAQKELEAALAIFAGRKSGAAVTDPLAYNRISALLALSELYARGGNEKKCLDVLRQAAQIALGTEGAQDKGHMRRGKNLMVHE